LRPPPEPSPSSSPLRSDFGRKLFIDAQASISVPSTLKCSLESSRFTRGSARSADRNRAETSPASSRARFFEKVE
jgi:hypothetical protein